MLVTAAVVAIALMSRPGLHSTLAFVVGAMVSATDPIAVIATFKRLGTSRRLSTLVEGEACSTTGRRSCRCHRRARTSEPVGLSDAVVSFVLTLIGRRVTGRPPTVRRLADRRPVDDDLIETMISVLLAYGTYIVADVLHESGVIATVVAGMTLGTYGRRSG